MSTEIEKLKKKLQEFLETGKNRPIQDLTEIVLDCFVISR